MLPSSSMATEKGSNLAAAAQQTCTDSCNGIAKSDSGKLKCPWRDSNPMVKENACTVRRRDSGWERGGATWLESLRGEKKEDWGALNLKLSDSGHL